MLPVKETIGFQVAAILRQYLAVDARNAAIDWPGTSGHLERIAGLIEILERVELPTHGDPLAAIEMEWRGIHRKLEAIDEIDAGQISSRAIAERITDHLRRWPSIECDSETRNRLRSQLLEIYCPRRDMLCELQPIALDGIRAVLRFELAAREAIEESEISRAGCECEVLRRAVALLDETAPDPLVEIGHKLGRAALGSQIAANDDDRAWSSTVLDHVIELETRADGLQATTLEGAMVHLMLAFMHSGYDTEDSGGDRSKVHIARARRVLEAHTGMMLEEYGADYAMPRSIDPLVPLPLAKRRMPARRQSPPCVVRLPSLSETGD